MSHVETSTYCSTCQRATLHHKERVNHILHLILSVLTVGLWLLVWIPLGMKNSATRMRCTVCGRKPGMGTVKHELAGAFGSHPRAATPASVADVPPSTWLPPGARDPR